MRIGLTEHINSKDLKTSFNQAEVALFECCNEKKMYSFFESHLTRSKNILTILI